MADRKALYRDPTSGQVSEVVSTDKVGNADAASIQGVPVNGATPTQGEILIYDPVSNSWIPGDPYVQGVFPAGTAVATANGTSPPVPLYPVMIGGSDGTDLRILKVDSSGNIYIGNTVTVSGSVTANAGTNLNTSALALESGGNLATIAGAVASSKMKVSAAAGDVVVEISDGTNVIGTSSHPVQVSLANTGSNSTAVKIDGSGVTQPVSGTVTVSGLTFDASSNLLTNPGLYTQTLTAWTSSTTVNTTQVVLSGSGAAAVLVQLDQSSGTFSAGQITFQGTYDGTNWVTVPAGQVFNAQTYSSGTSPLNPYTLVTNTNQPFLIVLSGFQSIRMKLTVAITGTGSVTPFVSTITNLSASLLPAYNSTTPLFVQTVSGSTTNIANWDGTALGAPTAWGSAPSGNVIGVNANVLALPANATTIPGNPISSNYSTAVINFSSSGDNTIIAGVSSQTIRVYKIQFTVAGATNVKFGDTTVTYTSGAYVLTGNGSVYSDWMNGELVDKTASGKGYLINSSNAVSVQGKVWYTQS